MENSGWFPEADRPSRLARHRPLLTFPAETSPHSDAGETRSRTQGLRVSGRILAPNLARASRQVAVRTVAVGKLGGSTWETASRRSLFYNNVWDVEGSMGATMHILLTLLNIFMTHLDDIFQIW